MEKRGHRTISLWSNARAPPLRHKGGGRHLPVTVSPDPGRTDAARTSLISKISTGWGSERHGLLESCSLSGRVAGNKRNVPTDLDVTLRSTTPVAIGTVDRFRPGACAGSVAERDAARGRGRAAVLLAAGLDVRAALSATGPSGRGRADDHFPIAISTDATVFSHSIVNVARVAVTLTKPMVNCSVDTSLAFTVIGARSTSNFES